MFQNTSKSSLNKTAKVFLHEIVSAPLGDRARGTGLSEGLRQFDRLLLAHKQLMLDETRHWLIDHSLATLKPSAYVSMVS